MFTKLIEISLQEKEQIKQALTRAVAFEDASMLPPYDYSEKYWQLMVIQYKVANIFWKNTPDKLSTETKFDKNILHGKRWVPRGNTGEKIVQVFNSEFNKGKTGKAYRAKLSGKKVHLGSLID